MSDNRADNDRHWPVFWASFAVVLVTWGLVPTQAGIFSIQTVTRSTNRTFAVSTYSMPFEKQATSLSFRYAQSTYGIAALNETLPPYMTRSYILAPFKPSDTTRNIFDSRGNYTAPTTMYRLDLTCEEASKEVDKFGTISYSSSNGCSTVQGLDGNSTLGYSQTHIPSTIYAVREYVGSYIGYHRGAYASKYLIGPLCPETANTTFYAAFGKSKVRLALFSPAIQLTSTAGARCRSSSKSYHYFLSIPLLAAAGFCYRR
jgi:hypothetical protein